MEKVYYKIKFYCSIKKKVKKNMGGPQPKVPEETPVPVENIRAKCSKRKLKKVERDLNKDISEKFSQNNLRLELIDWHSLSLKEDCDCSCQWYLTYQKKPTKKTSGDIYTSLFTYLEPKIIEIKKTK